MITDCTYLAHTQDWSDLHLLAVSVMSLCLLADGGMEALHSSDCLQKFLLGIKDSTLPSVQAKAVSIETVQLSVHVCLISIGDCISQSC